MNISAILDALRTDVETSAEGGDRKTTEAVIRMGRLLEATVRVQIMDAMSEAAAEPMTRITWEIAEEFGVSRLTVTHELEDAPIHAALVHGDVPQAGGGWPFVLSDLKTLLETGQALGR